ncbi:unnamed protein product, partial [Symbiodinium necroappetens]
GGKGGDTRSPSGKRRRPSKKKKAKSQEKPAACCISPLAALAGESSGNAKPSYALAARKSVPVKPRTNKVQFRKPEIIDIPLEGKGKKFILEKREYDFQVETADECPPSDPEDMARALSNALALESAVKGIELGIRVKCSYRCRGREGFCAKCKEAVPLPSYAAAAVTSENLEIIADTGSEEDLISRSDLEAHFKGKAKKVASNPVSLLTANGPVDAETKHEVYVESLRCYANSEATSQCLATEDNAWSLLEDSVNIDELDGIYGEVPEGTIASITLFALPEGEVEAPADSDVEPQSVPKAKKDEASLRAEAVSLEHRLTHRPKNPFCPICQRAKMY